MKLPPLDTPLFPVGWDCLGRVRPGELSQWPVGFPVACVRGVGPRGVSEVAVYVPRTVTALMFDVFVGSDAHALLRELEADDDLPKVGWLYTLAATFPGVPFARIAVLYRMHPPAVLDPVRRAVILADACW